MPDKKTLERVERDRRQGKYASTQAGEFVRETIDHIRQGKHGARSTKQAIAIGLSKARRAGVDLPPPARPRDPRSNARLMVEEITAMSKVGKKQQDVLERTSSKSDEQIDEAIEESFPASDPPSYAVPVSPARTGPEPEPKKRER